MNVSPSTPRIPAALVSSATASSKVVHIRESGYAPANLFRRGQSRAPAHKLFGNIFGFRRENIFAQPLVKRHVVVQARETASSAHAYAH